MSNQSSDSTSHNYRPRSPDLSGFVAPPPPRLNRLPSLPYQNSTDSGFPQGYSFSPRGSYDASPYFSPQASQPVSYFGSQSQSQSSQPIFSQPYTFSQSDNDQMARLRARNTRVNYNDDNHQIDQFDQTVAPIVQQQQQQSFSQFPPQPQSMTTAPQLIPQPPPFQQLQMQPQLPLQQQPQQPQPLQPQNQPPPFQSMPPQIHQSTLPQIEIRTKFPVARIKRIMQADEDIGKVAQATPTAVAKALELFMIALVSKGSLNAKEQSSKRVTATHLKNALLSDSQFDFLNEICENVAEEGGGKRKKGDGSAGGNKSEESDADEEIVGAGQKKKGRVRKKKAQSGDDSD